MTQTRSLILAALVIAASGASVCAQRRERLPTLRDPQFYAPRNQLEDFDGRSETILIKGRTWVGTVRAQNGTARVEATEIRDTATSKRAAGVVVTVMADGGPPGEIRSLIDYEEIDALVKAMDTALKSGEAVTKLTHFEVRYRTRGDFEVMVFKQLSDNAIAAAIEGGFFDRSRLYLTLDELTRLRWMMVQAKEKLDESK
jgi:hypothetical protein